jgi:hypothetical protein
MANGILGTPTDLTATTNTTIYTVPGDTFAVFTVNLVNRSGTDRNVRIAVAASGTPTTAEWIEYDTTIIGNGVLERTGIVAQAGKNIVVYANSTDVSAMVFGIETSTA